MKLKLAQPEPDGGWKRGIEVEAEKVKIHPTVQFAVHESHIDIHTYVVTHVKSGFAVGYGATKAQAIKHAKERIKPYKDLEKTIKELLAKRSYR